MLLRLITLGCVDTNIEIDRSTFVGYLDFPRLLHTVLNTIAAIRQSTQAVQNSQFFHLLRPRSYLSHWAKLTFTIPMSAALSVMDKPNRIHTSESDRYSRSDFGQASRWPILLCQTDFFHCLLLPLSVIPFWTDMCVLFLPAVVIHKTVIPWWTVNRHSLPYVLT